jgi:hypothetical protein
VAARRTGLNAGVEDVTARRTAAVNALPFRMRRTLRTVASDITIGMRNVRCHSSWRTVFDMVGLGRGVDEMCGGGTVLVRTG